MSQTFQTLSSDSNDLVFFFPIMRTDNLNFTGNFTLMLEILL